MLTSTPAEALAVAVRSLLAPLRLLRVPVSEIGERCSKVLPVCGRGTAGGRRLVMQQRASCSPGWHATGAWGPSSVISNNRMPGVECKIWLNSPGGCMLGVHVGAAVPAPSGAAVAAVVVADASVIRVGSLHFEHHAARCIGLTLLLSLRFMAVAFEEIRNLALGVAARGVQWPTLGPAGGIRVSLMWLL